MATSNHCAICGGSREEHGPDTIHQFTLVEGDLSTPPPAPQKMNPGMLMGSINPISFARFVETMLDKGLFSQEDALYIAGYAPKPVSAQYADPAGGGL